MSGTWPEGRGRGVGRARARAWGSEAGQRGGRAGEAGRAGHGSPPPILSTLEGGGGVTTHWEHPEWWEMGARELKQEEALGGIAA